MANTRRSPAQPSDLELQVLSVLWKRGPSTVYEMLEAMPDGKARAYTTVLTVLQGLEKKGLVDFARQGRQYVYRAKVGQKQVLRPLLRKLVQQVFGGDPAAVLQHLVVEKDVTEQAVRAMRRILDEHAASAESKTGRKS